MNQSERKYAVNRIAQERGKLINEKKVQLDLANVSRGYGANLTVDEIIYLMKKKVLRLYSVPEIVDHLKKFKNYPALPGMLHGYTEATKAKTDSQKALWDAYDKYVKKIDDKVNEMTDSIMLGAEAKDVVKFLTDLRNIK